MHQDKCDTLRAELYQPPPYLEEEHAPDLENPQAEDLPFKKITFNEVNEAINSTSSSLVPGYSQMNYQVVKYAWRNETS